MGGGLYPLHVDPQLDGVQVVLLLNFFDLLEMYCVHGLNRDGVEIHFSFIRNLSLAVSNGVGMTFAGDDLASFVFPQVKFA